MTLATSLDLSGQARELARNVQLKSRSDDNWEFFISPSLKFLNSDASVGRLRDAISQLVGRPVRIKIIDEEKSDLRTAAGIERQKVRDSMSEAEKAITDDPTVKALKEQMGAQLVEDSIQPIQ